MIRIFTIFSFVFGSMAVQAQSLEMYRFSNSSGVYAIGFNPALLADSRNGSMFNLGLFHVNTMPDAVFNDFVPSSKLNLKLKGTSFKTQEISLQGPSYMKQLRKNAAFAISTHYRALQKREGDFADIFVPNPQTGNTQGLTGTYKSVGLKELAFSYAHPLAFRDHFIKVGTTIKLASLYHTYALESTNLTIKNSQLNGTLTGLLNTNAQSFNWLNMLKSKTMGTGMDLGFVYEYRPKYADYEYKMDGKQQYDPAVNKYLARIAFSITDLGGVKFDEFSRIGIYNQTTINQGNLEKGVPTAINELNLAGDKINKMQYMLPTRINLLAEVRLGKKGWHFGTAYRSATKRTAMGFNTQNVWAFYPRKEINGFEFSMPVIRNKITKKTGIGFQMKLGSFILGTEALNYLISKNSPNPSVYAGFSFSSKPKKIKDSDNDAVSDKKDLCKDIPGLWVFKGCPDTDGDGIQNSEDKCPDNAGPKETQGCPDADNDGIFDNLDACPNAKGLIRFNGCPDTDGDNIPDSEDDCPQKAGPEEFGGCPDSDGDGLIDSEDACPEVAGPKLFKGCPDTDGDGIPDKEDACKDAKGSLANGGCPDADGDGFVDNIDECPTEKGTLKGCPDTDSDGIKDSEDTCPTFKGTLANKGCPDTDGDNVLDYLDKCPDLAGSFKWSGCVLNSNFEPLDSLTSESNLLLKDLVDRYISKDIDNAKLMQLKTLNASLIRPLKLKVSGKLGSEIRMNYGLSLTEIGIEIIQTDQDVSESKIKFEQ